MNVTLSIDEELLARAREIAQQQGISLNEMIRRHLEMIAGRRPGEQIIVELQRLWEAYPGRSGGRKIAREEAYEERL